MKPKLSQSAIQLREQIDDTYGQERDRSADGWIGDSKHSSRVSDHNPDPLGWVRAIDVSRDLSGNSKLDLMPYLADQIRAYAKRDKSKRIAYIIFAGKIASPKQGWKFRKYSGINPHNHHMHISFNKGLADEDRSFFNIPMLGGSL